MAYTRGSIDDWNKWAEIVEDDTLKWDNMMPFMLKVCPSAGSGHHPLLLIHMFSPDRKIS